MTINIHCRINDRQFFTFIFHFTGSGESADSEKIRILSSAARGADNINNLNDRPTAAETCSSFTDSTTLSLSSSEGYQHKTASPGKNNELQSDDRTFYNRKFSLSPSDLDHSWSRRRSSMNGAIPGNGLRRTKSEYKISIHRNPVDNSYIDQKYGIMPSESASQKVVL